MEKGGYGTLLDIANATLGLIILVMSVHAAKCHGVAGSADIIFESVRVKNTIFTMIVTNVNIVAEGNKLKSTFGFNSRQGIHLCHEVGVSEVRVVIHKDGSTDIPFSCRFDAVDRNEAF